MNYVENYRVHLENLVRTLGKARAMQHVVGGDYEPIGQLEFSLLRTLGLKENDTILDIGCGTGRLGYAMRKEHTGKYIGTDILQDMLDYARDRIGRSDWRYLLSSAPPIPLADASVDIICLFSVFTHLLDEDVFRYLIEIRRLLKPDGFAVFSFLDFSVYSHWTIFERMLADVDKSVLSRFTSKDALTVLVGRAGMEVETFWNGDEPKVKLDAPIHYDDGRVDTGQLGFGQSVCVCRKSRTDSKDAPSDV